MHFETAVEISREMEANHPELVIAGFRRTSFERPVDSWAIDIVNPNTSTLVTLDEKDDWETRLSEIIAGQGATPS